MINIATIVCVMGDEAYFKMASVSIPCFLKNNTSANLFVFTDDVDRMNKLRNTITDEFHVVDMLKLHRGHESIVKDLLKKGCSEEFAKKHAERYGHFHKQIFVTSLIPIVEDFFKSKEYSHILKIDVDSYFAGGDMMLLVKKEIQKFPEFDLFLVERTHDLMCLYGGGQPGTGFVLWKKGSNFASRYIERFTDGFQRTILMLKNEHLVHTKILTRPGYHFVYPFTRANVMNREFTKEIASEFLPAYFHLSRHVIFEHMETMRGWFG